MKKKYKVTLPYAPLYHSNVERVNYTCAHSKEQALSQVLVNHGILYLYEKLTTEYSIDDIVKEVEPQESQLNEQLELF